MHASYILVIIAAVALALASAAVHKYKIEKGEKACFIAEMDVDIKVRYPTKDGGMEKVPISLPAPDDSGVTIEGSCGTGSNGAAQIDISFKKVTLSLNFTDNKGVVSLSGAEFTYEQDSSLFPNSSATGTVTASKSDDLLHMGSDKQYFQCHSPIPVQLNDNVTVEFKSMKVQAFNVDGKFAKKAWICPQDQPTVTPPVTPTGPTPTLAPSPPTGNWTVKQGNGTVCIVAHMGVRFVIPYEKDDKTNATAIVDVPTDASTKDSSCGNDTQDLVLEFNDGWKLSLTFALQTAGSKARTAAKDEYSVHTVELMYYHNEKYFPHAKTNQTVAMTARADGLQLYRAGVGMSYICNSKQEQKLSPNVTFDTFNLHVQAFKYNNATTFVGTEMECPLDRMTNSAVPIAVGAALAALVAIVLIAYAIGRKRSRTGYENV